MKKTITIILAVFCAITCLAQETEKRDLVISAKDQKGRNIKDLRLYAMLEGRENVETADNQGFVYISDVDDNDHVNVVINQSIYTFPLKDIDTLHLFIKKNKLMNYSVKDDIMVSDGYTTRPLRDNVRIANAVDVAQLSSYVDLASYMESRVPGVQVVREGNSVFLVIRGSTGATKVSHSAGTPGGSPGGMSVSRDIAGALIVVDGVAASSFDMVNASIAPMDVESITVDKQGSMYGFRGAHGVVIIKTKRGGSE